MSDPSKAAPRPWDWQWVSAGATGRGHIYILDASGRKIAAVWGKAGEKEHTADLIIDSVNEIEHLKDELQSPSDEG
jgi:hypothetical protein